MKKRLFSIFLLLAMLLCCGTVIANAAGFALVSDDAGLMTDQERTQLLAKAQKMADQTGYAFMIATTSYTGGRDSRTYGEEFYLNHTSLEDGIVYLIDMDNRRIQLVTSGALIYYMTDRRIEICCDDAYPYVSSGNYAGAFSVMLDNTKSYMESGSGADYTQDEDTGEVVYFTEENQPKSITLMESLMAIVAGLIGSISSALGISGSYKMKHKQYQYDYRNNHELQMGQRQDRMTDRRVATRAIPRVEHHDHSSSSGSSGGGGSTIHTGSGGHTFGGGGKSF